MSLAYRDEKAADIRRAMCRVGKKMKDTKETDK